MTSSILLDGNQLARTLREGMKSRVGILTARGLTPRLDVVLVGEDAASQVYVRNKVRACAEVGVASEVHRLAQGASEVDLLGLIDRLNRDERVHGILVQLPLPNHIASQKAIGAIAPEKDVDGFHLHNVGALMTGQPCFVPCTPAGVMALLDHAGVKLEGKHAVVVGRSNIVGKPVAMLLLQRGATVSICHSKTADLAAITRQADVLVVAVGKARMIDGSMIKPGAAVIDVGINRMADGKLAGDVDFQSCLGIAGCITPVPGGVGPMTVAMLIANTLAAAEQSHR